MDILAPTDLKIVQEALKLELKVATPKAITTNSQSSAPVDVGRKRLQIFEKITLTKSNKKKGGKK